MYAEAAICGIILEKGPLSWRERILIDQKMWDAILSRVEKPARYIGGEWNQTPNEGDLAVCLAFPDVYEVGMSHLGLKILYQILSQKPGVAVERAFAPWLDMERELQAANLPLVSMESHRPLAEFQILGFTLQYELSYTNVLQMLSLGKVPLFTEERTEKHPLVIAGGPCAFNPEPLAPFLDAVVLGEGEDVICEIVDCYRKWQEDGFSRGELLMALAKIPGVYVPSLYNFTYRADGTIEAIQPTGGAPGTITKRVVEDLAGAPYPENWLVPYTEIVHDRVMLEIMRGCTRGCRFCQAGGIYRPLRERPQSELLDLAEKLVSSTGYDEISLASLSSSDYSKIAELTRALLAKYGEMGVGVSLPSLRTDKFAIELAQSIEKVRKTGLTFAPEAGSQRLRDVINKGVTEDDLLTTAHAAFSTGWRRLKLYFMIGLPTETDEDVQAIGELARKVLAIGREHAKRGKGGVELSLSVSTFVPKPQTPFQWEPQPLREEIRRRQKLLRDEMSKTRSIKLSLHEPEDSFLEAVLARGDRRLASAILAAWQAGCHFDSWSEQFSFRTWLEAFQKTGVDPAFYANRQRQETEILPWDHLKSGLKKSFLWQERLRAYRGELTADCRGGCRGCGVCPELGVANHLAGE
mgnify:FL=1